MGYKRVILPAAGREFRQIIDYLARVLESPQAARDFMAEFDRCLDLACENPELFAVSRMPELAARGYRPILVKNYVALVAFDGDTVRVAHIFHQTQDYARLV